MPTCEHAPVSRLPTAAVSAEFSAMNERPRLYLSPPHMGGDEFEFVRSAFETNWIAPVGPNVVAFEDEFAAHFGFGHAAALDSGTAALHLATRVLGVKAGDTVLCSTLTFIASANPVTYQGARPVFIDSDDATWNMDPARLEEALESLAERDELPRAVIVVDLYGQCANYGAIVPICARYEVPIIEDAAEALGATCNGRPAGAFGLVSGFSFNGNKIITTSGGGMLVSEDSCLVERARFFATQARDPATHYEHSEYGYNYRMSNVLAGIGRGQLRVLEDRVVRRRRIFESYRKGLEGLPGLAFMPDGRYGRSTRWLTCLTIDPDVAGVHRDTVRLALEDENIEARPVWKPLHLQRVFKGCEVFGGSVSERLFAHGLCLPSGSAMTDDDIARVVGVVRQVFANGGRKSEVRGKRPAAGMGSP